MRLLSKAKKNIWAIAITLYVVGGIAYVAYVIYITVLVFSGSNTEVTPAKSPDEVVISFMGYMEEQDFQKASQYLSEEYFDGSDAVKQSVTTWVAEMEKAVSISKLNSYEILYSGDLNRHTSSLLRGSPNKVYALSVTFEYSDGTLQEGNVQFLFPLEKEGSWYLVMGSKDLERELAEKGLVDPKDAFNTMTSVQ